MERNTLYSVVSSANAREPVEVERGPLVQSGRGVTVHTINRLDNVVKH